MLILQPPREGEPLKTPRFDYHAPETLEEALALLAEHGDEAKLLAGGQSLVPLLAMRLARPAQLVDLGKVASLDGLQIDDGHVSVGAMVRERTVERSAVVAERVPVLTEALPYIGHVAIRNRGTIGGSLAHADASAELPAVAIVTEATMVVRRASGERTVDAASFFLGHFTSALEDDECLVEIRFPSTAPGVGWAFEEVARRHGDFAIVGTAAMVALDGAGAVAGARIAQMGVGDRAVRAGEAEAALVGATPTPEVIADAAREATAGLEPASDIHGSSEFRRHLATVSVRRALTRAVERAGGTR
ncbi:MAG TPA: FAD binding domain-containing protein [Acidimicrobiales bacterium]